MMKIHPLIYFLAGVCLIFLSLWVFTKPAFSSDWDFSNKGQIGDTIGGISAPIINLIGAILVFLSFKEQFEANKIQREALKNEIDNINRNKEFDTLFSIFREIKDEVNGFNYVNYLEPKYMGDGFSNAMTIEHKGTKGISEFMRIVVSSQKFYGADISQFTASLGEIKYIVGSLDDLRIKIESSALLTQSDKDLLHKKVLFYYEAKLSLLITTILDKTLKTSLFLKTLRGM
jgi:hypothetical protein